ncbi:NUDIX hydrolase [Aspergillus undulatus]|uniref:NUDIX hydrolase n=1 Tax=Aspergillus undulatus TaxID=1810928 RepID=UPI003CCE2818
MRRAPFPCALRIANTNRPSRNPNPHLNLISIFFSAPRHRRHLSSATSGSKPSTADMPRLNPASQAAINRLRSFTPPPTNYDLVPLSRRAAVLLLLYGDSNGDLRVVLTIRASTLSSYAGQAALPGGKSDSQSESPLQTARREASEEIGLPGLTSPLPPPFSVEHLGEIPCSLARTELVVRPVVALLHSHDEATGRDADPETELIPRLDAREVAAVFTAPFADFLRVRPGESGGDGEWYRGVWTEWWGTQWRMHQFHVPIDPSRVIKPRPHDEEQQEAVHALENQEQEQRRKSMSMSTETETVTEQTRYRVFGMTARILVDVARIAYNRQPEFEHNAHTGDEELITRLRGRGRLGEAKM